MSRIRELIRLEKELTDDKIMMLDKISVAGYKLIVNQSKNVKYIKARKKIEGRWQYVHVGRVTSLIEIERILKEKERGED